MHESGEPDLTLASPSPAPEQHDDQPSDECVPEQSTDLRTERQHEPATPNQGGGDTLAPADAAAHVGPATTTPTPAASEDAHPQAATSRRSDAHIEQASEPSPEPETSRAEPSGTTHQEQTDNEPAPAPPPDGRSATPDAGVEHSAGQATNDDLTSDEPPPRSTVAVTIPTEPAAEPSATADSAVEQVGPVAPPGAAPDTAPDCSDEPRWPDDEDTSKADSAIESEPTAAPPAWPTRSSPPDDPDQLSDEPALPTRQHDEPAKPTAAPAGADRNASDDRAPRGHQVDGQPGPQVDVAPKQPAADAQPESGRASAPTAEPAPGPDGDAISTPRSPSAPPSPMEADTHRVPAPQSVAENRRGSGSGAEPDPDPDPAPRDQSADDAVSLSPSRPPLDMPRPPAWPTSPVWPVAPAEPPAPRPDRSPPVRERTDPAPALGDHAPDSSAIPVAANAPAPQPEHREQPPSVAPAAPTGRLESPGAVSSSQPAGAGREVVTKRIPLVGDRPPVTGDQTDLTGTASGTQHNPTSASGKVGSSSPAQHLLWSQPTVPLVPSRTAPEPGPPGHQSTDHTTNSGPTAPRAKHRVTRRRALFALATLILVVAVAGGVVVSSPGLRRRLGLPADQAVPTAAPPAPVNYSPQITPLDVHAPMPTADGVATALAALSGNPVLGRFGGTVLDADTGTVLWKQNMSTALLPASTNKILTSAAALLSLNPLSTLTTTVVAGADPTTVVLVGGGDPTLNSLPAPQQSVYPGSPRLDDLAAQVKKAHPAPITHVVVDTSAYTGPAYGPEWTQSANNDDYTQVVPAMMDGGRLDPASSANLWDTPRTQAPAQAVGAALAARLGVASSAVDVVNTPTSGRILGEVRSAPLQDLIANLLEISDNMLAEALGRLVAKADGKPESFAGATSAVVDILHRNGFNTTGSELSDSSGLSPQDQVAPSLLAQVLRVATEPATSPDPRVGKLRPLLAGLPIAGATGTLSVAAGLYSAPQAAAGKGWVRAKTGTLGDQGTNTLAGYVLDRDGRILVFALMSNSSPDSGQVPAVLDTMTAVLRGCGCTG